MQSAHSRRSRQPKKSAPQARRRADRARQRRSAAAGSADRSIPPEPSAQAAGRHVLEPGIPPAPRRAGTTADGGATATPSARAPGRCGARRMSESSSQSRTRRRSARSPTSRCPRPPPRQRMTQPPPLRLKRRQRAPDLVLRASSNAAATSHPNPVASVEPEPERGDEQGAGCRDGSRARDGQRQQHSRTARHRRHSSSRQPAVLLAARVVQPALSWIHGMRSSSHRHPTAPPHATLASSAVLDSVSGVSSGRSCT
jgi:hypothetical protein